MSLQRKHFLLSYLKTLSVGPAGAWTHNLPHSSLALYQLSQPVGGKTKILKLHLTMNKSLAPMSTANKNAFSNLLYLKYKPCIQDFLANN